jgi:glucose-6-phosphate isomerase
MCHYENLDECAGFRELEGLAPLNMKTEFTPDRISNCTIHNSEGLIYNWSASPIGDTHIRTLQKLADEQELVTKYRLLSKGDVMNTGEKRLVLHHLARGELSGKVFHDGVNMREFYEGERKKAADFAYAVRDHKIRSPEGKPFSTVVQVGIGGSDLGPRAACIALERWAESHGRKKMEARFISNVDPDDADHVLGSIDLARSLFVLVSKSGTTLETLANETLVRTRLTSAGLSPDGHIVAVTSKTSPLANNSHYLASFYIDDFIGGRYSTSSAVGGVIMSLAFGPETFSEFLAGAHEADVVAMKENILENPALLDAMIGLYERNVLKMPCTAILPYAEPLSRFPAHLQQLDMESNGKSVNRDGKPLAYQTGPIVFGEPGTNGQHSFYQLLHQGTDIVPLQFIGFLENQNSMDVVFSNSSSRQKLLANLLAQIVAFLQGKEDNNPNKHFPGGRPSTLILGKRLGPKQLGALFSHYENKVMFQGFAWNINSFDQEGVQLGKVLATKVLEGMTGNGNMKDPILLAMLSLLDKTGT